MTARQQIARVLPLVLLVILVAAGLRGEVLSPRWNGPLTSDGIVVGLVLEVIFAALLTVTLRTRLPARARRGLRDDPGRLPGAGAALLRVLAAAAVIAAAALVLPV